MHWFAKSAAPPAAPASILNVLGDIVKGLAPPAPPPLPPPPASLHLQLAASRDDFEAAATACAVLALLILLAAWAMWSKRSTGSTAKPLVTVEAAAHAKDRVAVLLRHAPASKDSAALAKHCRRLLLERGFAEVREVWFQQPELDTACRGAHLAIDFAFEAAEGSAPAGTEALLTACAAHGVRSVVQCTDALVGYDTSGDICDGDELSDPGISLISPEPRPPPPTSERLGALAASEAALAAHVAAQGGSCAAIVLRLHRVYTPELVADAALPLALLLASGVGLGLGGARAQTSLLHVEDAALGLSLAADKLLGGAVPSVSGTGVAVPTPATKATGVETVVLSDPAVWSVPHLLRCLARALHLPPPLLPGLMMPARLLAALASKLGVPAAADTVALFHNHCYYTGLKASTALGFVPQAGAAGLHAALAAAAARAALPLRAAPVLMALSCALALDAYDLPLSSTVAVAAAAGALLCALRPAAASLPPQPPIAPPLVAGGVPVLGHLLSFIKGPVSMIDGLRVHYRSMFTIRVGPQRITFMIGAGPQVSFCKSKDEVLDQAPVYKFTIPVFGEGIVYDSPLDERQQQVKLLVHSMNTKGLEAMVPKMIDEAEDYFRAWGDEGEVELRQVFSELIIMTASSCLMGPEIRENLSAEIARIYHALDGGLTPLSTIWPSAPTAKHRERDEARKEMVSIFSRIIANRRSGAVPADDFLQKIIDFRYRDETDPKTGRVTKAGRGFTDSEVTGWLVVLLFAGQHTSSITSTWLGAMLLAKGNEEARAAVKAEQEKYVPDEESLTYANLLQMDGMRRAITETLRLYPPLILLMRKVMTDGGLKVGAHTIPKGDVVGLCAPASNLDPRYWSDVTDFKPERYLPGSDAADMFDSRSVGHGLMQGFMLSFGGGAHMCSGRRFGYLQVSTIWSILLRDFEMEMVTPLPKPAYNDMVVGPDAPIMMRYKRKTPLAQAAAAKAAAAAARKASAVTSSAAAANGGGAAAAVAAGASGGVSLSKPVGSGAFPRGRMVILWGSQSGTAEGYGNQLMREARALGYDAASMDIEAYPPEKLADEDEAPVVFLLATHGEGEPTDNAVPFYEFFEAERCDNLKSLKFAAFGLGNRQYQFFNAMGKWIDAKATALGATRLVPTGLGDADDDIEGDYEAWRASLWSALCPDIATGGADGASVAAAALLSAPAAARFACEWGAEAAPDDLSFLAKVHPKQSMLTCRVAANAELAQQPQCGSVKQVDLSCAATAPGGAAATLAYRTADDLAVCCDNGAALAARTAARLGLELARVFTLTGGAGAPPPPLPTPCSVEQALRFHVDLLAPASKELLALLAAACADAKEAATLRGLCAADAGAKQRYHDYIARDGRGLAELLAEFGSCAPSWAALLELAPKLAPRYYTISSSPAHDASTVSLTVKVLREPMRGAPGRTKEGVCSTQLGALAPGGTAHVFVRSSGFALPQDETAPVIMVGPGTGIAPFRAFLQELQAKGGPPRAGHVRLYFGCRREAEDYLYKDELAAHLQAGTLGALRLAFSRETAAKVYVQSRVAEDGAELVKMLQSGGHVYICGGTSMGRDVVAAVQEAVRVHGGLPAEAAEAYIKAMQTQGRLVQELWS